MATVEHCLCCFEALAAHHENRKPMTLSEIEKSWAEYVTSVEVDDEAGGQQSKIKRLPALRRLAGASPSSPGSLSTSGSSTSSTTSLGGASTPATSVASSSLSSPPSQPLITESPLFVTWNIHKRGDTMLRGCIGTFEAQELDEGLPSYALTSALNDMRFSPIAYRELPSLEVAVTLLTNFEGAEDAMDWELGKHGLRISFSYHGRRYGSTYLPDVAVEQGWTKEETVVSLMRKAGWMGKKDKWTDVELKVVRYQGKKESLDYAEYKRWRDWVDSKKSRA